MAFPWIFQSNFEAGTNAEWDSETDTGSRLDFPHYSTLAAIPGMAMPFKGAYCMRIQCGDTNDHTLTEGDIDIADGATRYFRFQLYVANNFTATADDVFSIFELQQAGGTVEATMGMRITAATNLLEIGIGDGTAPSSYVTFPRGRWVNVEWAVLVSTTGTGTSTLFIDNAQAVALTSQTHAAAVGQGVLGTQLTLSTTTGTILFDDFYMDDARLGPVVDRFKQSVYMTKTMHAFIGPGEITGISLVAGAATDNTVNIYDTDTGSTADQSNIVYSGGAAVASTTVDLLLNEKIKVTRGAYVVLSGTTPRASVRFNNPHSLSDGGMRNYAAKRLPGPYGA